MFHKWFQRKPAPPEIIANLKSNVNAKYYLGRLHTYKMICRKQSIENLINKNW